MSKEIIVLGELHQDLYYESDFYEQLVNSITNKLLNFLYYNPDDLINRRLLERLVKQSFSDTPQCVQVGQNQSTMRGLVWSPYLPVS